MWWQDKFCGDPARPAGSSTSAYFSKSADDFEIFVEASFPQQKMSKYQIHCSAPTTPIQEKLGYVVKYNKNHKSGICSFSLHFIRLTKVERKDFQSFH